MHFFTILFWNRHFTHHIKSWSFVVVFYLQFRSVEDCKTNLCVMLIVVCATKTKVVAYYLKGLFCLFFFNTCLLISDITVDIINVHLWSCIPISELTELIERAAFCKRKPTEVPTIWWCIVFYFCAIMYPCRIAFSLNCIYCHISHHKLILLYFFINKCFSWRHVNTWVIKNDT